MSPSRSAAIARHELRLLRSDPVFFIINCLMPLAVMAFVKQSFRFALAAQGHPGVNGAEQAVPGMAVMFALFLQGNIGVGFFREHGWGTWERLRASWATPGEIMTGKVVVPLLQAAAQLAILFGLGGVLYHLHISGSVLAFVAVAAAFGLCGVALSMALLAICQTVMQLNAVANLAAIVLAGIGGAIAPTAALPGWARAIAPGTPSYWAMRGFRDVILDGGGPQDVVLPIVMLFGFTVVFLVVASLRFRFEQTKTSWA
jgi:ABC-2 type transport system permease protein